MNVLVLAAIFGALISPANAQTGIPNSGAPGVPVPGAPPSSRVKVFTVKRADRDRDWTCEQGSIESLSALQVADEKNVSVVFLDHQKKDIPPGVWVSAYGFRFEQEPPKDDVRVTMMICGG